MPTKEKMQEVFQNMMNYLETELSMRDDLSEEQQEAIRDAIGKVIDIQKRALEEDEPDMPGIPACSDYNDAIGLLVSEDDFEDGVPSDTDEDLDRHMQHVDDPSLKQAVRQMEDMRKLRDPLRGLKIITDFHATPDVACDIANTALERLYSHYLAPRQKAREHQKFMDNLTPRGRTALNVLREFTGLKADQQPQMQTDLLTLTDFADGKEVSGDAVQQALTRIKEKLPSSRLFQPTIQRGMQVAKPADVDPFLEQIKDYVHNYYVNLDSIREFEQAAAEQDRLAQEAALAQKQSVAHELISSLSTQRYAHTVIKTIKREWHATGVPKNQITGLAHRMEDACATLAEYVKASDNKYAEQVPPNDVSAALDTLKDINRICHMNLTLPASSENVSADTVTEIFVEIKSINDKRLTADSDLIKLEEKQFKKLSESFRDTRTKLKQMSDEEQAQYINNLAEGFVLDCRAKNGESDPQNTELTDEQKQAAADMRTVIAARAASLHARAFDEKTAVKVLPLLEKLEDQYQLGLPPIDDTITNEYVASVLKQLENISEQRHGELTMPDMTPKNRAQYIRSTLNSLALLNHPDRNLEQAGKLASSFSNLAGFAMNQPDAKAAFVRQGVETLFEQYPRLKAKYDTGVPNTPDRVTAMLKDCFEIEKRRLSPVNRKAMGSFNPFTAKKLPYAGKPAQAQQKQAEKQMQQPQMGH